MWPLGIPHVCLLVPKKKDDPSGVPDGPVRSGLGISRTELGWGAAGEDLRM